MDEVGFPKRRDMKQILNFDFSLKITLKPCQKLNNLLVLNSRILNVFPCFHENVGGRGEGHQWVFHRDRPFE